LFICAKDLFVEANGGLEAQSHQAFILVISDPRRVHSINDQRWPVERIPFSASAASWLPTLVGSKLKYSCHLVVWNSYIASEFWSFWFYCQSVDVDVL